ncbi:hypothetical protein BJ875DRAFT_99840 [Amylocarpus encephaloides]|uniref:Zn(2)-C6 fungal-type domain-containing protein n=1 Tax=Amylocarpus encephaloides TaxID=45428 RepID=A0A9P7YE33_9HELO|nr:hypothetical protein BJ875DRAFT_99840 [Amylocarpus encephaloides]
MEVGPDQKRPRLAGPAPAQWQSPAEGSRQLPPPASGPSSYHNPSPFSRPPEPQHHLDRRSSGNIEHSQYEHHNSRRPGSGPPPLGYHPPPPFTAQRDTAMVKRDPSDEPPPHYRPPSTGTPTEKNPNPPHDGQRAYLPPFSVHHQAHPPYQPGQASYPPPHSPMTATDSYHQQPHFGGPPPTPRELYNSVSYPATSNQQNSKRPKAQRAAQACDSCRTLKGKCDEGRPDCTSCKEKGISCHYRDPPPKQQDKASGEILDSISLLTQHVIDLKGDMYKRLEQIEARLSLYQSTEAPGQHQFPRRDAQMNGEDPRSLPDSILSERPSAPPAVPSTESPYPPNQTRFEAPERTENPQEGEETEEEGGDLGPAKPSSIPVNHTTGAARLLNEPAIGNLVDGSMGSRKPKNAKYPIVQEEKRGLLRIYGRGEGIDAPPGYDRDPLIDHTAESISGDTNSDVSSPAGEEWGQLGGMTPPGNPPQEFVRGNINSEGMPDFSRETVKKLVQSYKENINNMHPILVPSKLDLLIENFLKSTPESHLKPKGVTSLIQNYSNPVSVGFVIGNPESPGNKRKRSPAIPDTPEMINHYDVKPGHPFRSISSALVLLVLALGEICLHKSKIRETVSDRDTEAPYANSPTVRNGHPPSPFQNSPSMSTPRGAPSPQDHDRGQSRSRRTSIEGAYMTKGIPGVRAKNLDVIPGLFYFALATDIIGNQLGGNSLQHVHANLLAGLYHGQLARVIESHAYIHQACRGLQVILRPKLDRFRKLKMDGGLLPPKDNALVIAFWTCLQLESDIVAELPCPHSGILTFEEDMPVPNFKTAADIDGFDPLVVESYGAQLFLRKHLNQLHKMFYSPEDSSQFPYINSVNARLYIRNVEAFEENISDISMFAPKMQWKDSDGYARTILSARLRAKYYGAQVITYRPFVLRVLKENSNDLSVHKDPIDDPEVNRKVLEFARMCIRATINSTSAFWGLGTPGKRRLIVTNVWGTAHAQWGNMLVLQAALRDPILREYVDEEEVKILLRQTIDFLKLVAQNSSALANDHKILTSVGQNIGLLPPDSHGPNPSSSFSSNTTGDMATSGH